MFNMNKKCEEIFIPETKVQIWSYLVRQALMCEVLNAENRMSTSSSIPVSQEGVKSEYDPLIGLCGHSDIFTGKYQLFTFCFQPLPYKTLCQLSGKDWINSQEYQRPGEYIFTPTLIHCQQSLIGRRYCFSNNTKANVFSNEFPCLFPVSSFLFLLPDTFAVISSNQCPFIMM